MQKERITQHVIDRMTYEELDQIIAENNLGHLDFCITHKLSVKTILEAKELVFHSIMTGIIKNDKIDALVIKEEKYEQDRINEDAEERKRIAEIFGIPSENIIKLD